MSAPVRFTAKREGSPPPGASRPKSREGFAGWARLSGRTFAWRLEPSPPAEEPSTIAVSAIAPTIGTSSNTRLKRGPSRRRRRRRSRRRRRPKRRREPPVSRGGSSSLIGRRLQQPADDGHRDHDEEEQGEHAQWVQSRGCDHADRQGREQHYERKHG